MFGSVLCTSTMSYTCSLMYLSHIGAQSVPVTIDPCAGVIVTILFSVIDMQRIWNLAITIKNSTQILWTCWLKSLDRTLHLFLNLLFLHLGKPCIHRIIGWKMVIFDPPKTYTQKIRYRYHHHQPFFWGKIHSFKGTARLWVNVT